MKHVSLLTVLWVGLGMAMKASAQTAPFADVHIHYNWEQAELISPQEVVEKLKRQHVRLAVVSSTPSQWALKLAKAAGGDWIHDAGMLSR